LNPPLDVNAQVWSLPAETCEAWAPYTGAMSDAQSRLDIASAKTPKSGVIIPLNRKSLMCSTPEILRQPKMEIDSMSLLASFASRIGSKNVNDAGKHITDTGWF